MNTLKHKPNEINFLSGHLLIAMPHMGDERFKRSVIYICTHSDEGATGIILNRKTNSTLLDIMSQLNMSPDDDETFSRHYTETLPIRCGGPVEPNRGFVIHSDDYACKATTSVENHIALTSTLDILKAIGEGKGPHNVIVALGHSAWVAGQLEAEIMDNSWLIFKANNDLIFSCDLENLYDNVLKAMGVNLALLSLSAGHA